MGSWNYTNIGVSATSENEKHVKAILRYIGYGEEPDYSEEGDNHDYYYSFDVVYVCLDSDYPKYGAHFSEAFTGFDEQELLYLMNALFPGTTIEVHHAEGNNTSDTWEKHVETYDTDTMTYSVSESYTDYGGGGPEGERSWDERFAMRPPKPEYVQALIDSSTADDNSELTALLLELSRKLRDGLIVYKDDPADKRLIGQKYNEVDDVSGEEGWDEDGDDWGEDEDEEENGEETNDAPEVQTNIITFGYYPQTESGDDRTPIEWLVLEREGNKALVVSRHGLDAKPYHENMEMVTWKNCTLRKWLNGDFLDISFSEAERTAVLVSEVDTSDIQSENGSEEAIITQDRVFLLSCTEVKKFFDGEDACRCAPTDYAIDQGAYSEDKFNVAGRACGWWWLRSPGNDQISAARVYPDGSLHSDGVFWMKSGMVRPALWIKLDSEKL